MEFHTKIAKWESDGLLPGQWWVVEVSKRLGNPYPDRITVGRASNCDVALRFPYMSKVHSRFLIEGGRNAKLEDCGSSNGTFRNGVRLTEGQPIIVMMGDRLTFGNLEVEFVDAKTLYERAQKGPR